MYSLILFMSITDTKMEIDAMGTTVVKGVKLLFKAALPHGCMAQKEKPSPMPGNSSLILVSKFLENSATSIK